jgi:lactate permease
VVATLAILIDPVEDALERVEVGIPFPATETGYDVEREAEDAYSEFAPLTHPGTFLLLASGVAWVLYRRAGRYEAWEDEAPGESEPIVAGMAGDAIPASLAIVSFLVLSTVMDHSGQTEVLAVGASEVAPAGVFAFFAGWIGLLGSFMTSSNASSNVIFAPLQQTLAETQGLPEASVMAAQHAGGAIGNSISPSNIVLGTGAVGIVGQEGTVLRKVAPYALVSAALVGVGTVIFTM